MKPSDTQDLQRERKFYTLMCSIRRSLVDVGIFFIEFGIFFLLSSLLCSLNDFQKLADDKTSTYEWYHTE